MSENAIPRAEVARRASDEESGVWFWHHGKIGGGRVQCGSHVTKFTPNYCRRHSLAHDQDECPRCVA